MLTTIFFSLAAAYMLHAAYTYRIYNICISLFVAILLVCWSAGLFFDWFAVCFWARRTIRGDCLPWEQKSIKVTAPSHYSNRVGTIMMVWYWRIINWQMQLRAVSTLTHGQSQSKYANFHKRHFVSRHKPERTDRLF